MLDYYYPLLSMLEMPRRREFHNEDVYVSSQPTHATLTLQGLTYEGLFYGIFEWPPGETLTILMRYQATLEVRLSPYGISRTTTIVQGWSPRLWANIVHSMVAEAVALESWLHAGSLAPELAFTVWVDGAFRMAIYFDDYMP